MKMLNIFSKNNVARDTFKEVSEFMETLKSIKIFIMKVQ